MSHYQDFMGHADGQTRTFDVAVKRGARPGDEIGYTGSDGRHYRVSIDKFAHDIAPYTMLATIMRRSKIIRMSGEQAQVFLDTPEMPGQDYATWFRLPFPEVYIHPTGRMVFTEYAAQIDEDIAKAEAEGEAAEAERLRQIQREANPEVKGVVLTERTPEADPGWFTSVVREGERPTMTPLLERAEIALDNVVRVITCVYMMPIPTHFFNIHAVNLVVTKDGRLINVVAAQQQVRERMRAWVLHVCNFLSSPSVKLVANGPSRELQRARQKAGKPALPGWYEITWRKLTMDYGPGKIAKGLWKHSYRYDVRAHQRLYTRGAMAGRIVWVKSHQRGVANVLYKPAVRVIGDSNGR
jgi:hypothetical protein